tara:strand:+ start:17 stop:1375 length:1359 start_codon:yes stop_codon:yes gene_type:complete
MKVIDLNPTYAEAHYNLGLTFQRLGETNSAVKCYENSIDMKQDYAEAHFSLGNLMQQLKQFNSAIENYEKVIKINPNFVDAFSNLGAIYTDLGRLKDAESSYKKAILIDPEYAEAHNNLSVNLKDLGRLEEAEISCREAIKINPEFGIAYYNLGNILKATGRLNEAEESFKSAISFHPEDAEIYNMLGAVLKDLGKLDEAESSCKQAIELNPDYIEAYSSLSLVHYAKKDLSSALEILIKAKKINPSSKVIKLLFAVLNSKNKSISKNISVNDPSERMASNPLIINRNVDKSLIDMLYSLKSLDLDKRNDPSYGNSKGSDYDLFENKSSLLKKTECDLVNILSKALNSEIYLQASFYTIYGSGGGVITHNHISPIDEDSTLKLALQKYSLVYYLSVGNQEASEPGILKLFDPEEDILPSDGMIVIFPADRYHSASYNGSKDRIIIGINFYTI